MSAPLDVQILQSYRQRYFSCTEILKITTKFLWKDISNESQKRHKEKMTLIDNAQKVWRELKVNEEVAKRDECQMYQTCLIYGMNVRCSKDVLFTVWMSDVPKMSYLRYECQMFQRCLIYGMNVRCTKLVLFTVWMLDVPKMSYLRYECQMFQRCLIYGMNVRCSKDVLFTVWMSDVPKMSNLRYEC